MSLAEELRSRKRNRKDLRQHTNLMQSRRVQATPWSTAYEWEVVGAALTSAVDDLELPFHTAQADPFRGQHLSLIEALEKVEVWKCRHQSLPIAIEASHALAGCIHADRCDNNTIPASNIALQYASAISRCINGLVDVMQQGRQFASSVAALSSQLGIPLWLVEVRHQATHQQLPSLPVLRSAATTLLQYLNQVYWTPKKMQRMQCIEKISEQLQEGNIITTVSNLDHAHQKRSSIESTWDSEDKGSMEEEDLADESGISNHEMSLETPAPSFETSVLGTSFNRFAALNEPTKKLRLTTNADSSDSTKASTSSLPKKRTRKESAALPTSTSAIHRKAKIRSLAHIPMDILFHVATEHISKSSCVVSADTLAAHSPERSPASSPVIFDMIRLYPGLFHTFLKALVYQVCNASAIATTTRSFLAQNLYWIVDHICSPTSPLVTYTARQIRNQMVQSSSLAAFLPPQWKLVSWIDQCRSRNTPASREAAQLLEKVQQHSFSFFVPPLNAIAPVTGVKSGFEESTKSFTNDPSISTQSTQGMLSLSEMEAFLQTDTALSDDNDEHGNQGLHADADAEQLKLSPRVPAPGVVVAWVLCTNWEPCAIGSCP